MMVLKITQIRAVKSPELKRRLAQFHLRTIGDVSYCVASNRNISLLQKLRHVVSILSL